MSSADARAVRVSAPFQALCRTLLSMDVPAGYRAEVVGGSIILSPSPPGYYFPGMRSLRTQLEPQVPAGHVIDSAPFLFTFPEQERAYGPDVYAVDASAFDTEQRHLDGEALSFVAELTSSSTREADWSDKTPVYGQAGVPVYLLLDMQEEAATVFWQPSPAGYISRLTVPFGEPLTLPAPFRCDLDTSAFGLPRDSAADAEG